MSGDAEAGLPPALARATRDLAGAPPDDPAARAAALERLLAAAREELEAARAAQQQDAPRALRELFVGREEAFAATLELVARAAGTALPAWIEGERGTGKGVVARALHGMSPRRAAPLRWLDARAAGTEALETAWEEAASGSVVLAGLEALDPPGVARLERLLGGERAAAPRLIVTSREEAGRLVERGALTESLAARLSVLRHRLAPLRETPAAIAPLFAQRLARAAGGARLPEPLLAEDARALLRAAPWPGNVAEVERVARRAWADSGEATLTAAHLEPYLGGADSDQPTLEALERRWIAARLEACGWHQERTARSLGIDRKTLWRKIRRYGLDRS